MAFRKDRFQILDGVEFWLSKAPEIHRGMDWDSAFSWRVLHLPEGKQRFTHHGFTGIPHENRIDWILTATPPHVVDVWIVHDQSEGRYASDHFPYYADLAWDI